MLERNRGREVEEAYGKERMKFYNRNGQGLEALEEERNRKSNLEIKIVEREREQQRQWEQNRIDRSKYNKRYKEINM